MASVLASYAIEHFFLSGLLLILGAAVVRWVPAHSRHPWLLGALLMAVLGPLLSVAIMAPVGGPTALLATGSPTVDAATGGRLGLDPTWVVVMLGLWGAVGIVRLCRLVASWRSASALARISPRSLEIERNFAGVLPRGARVHLSTSFGPAVLGVLNPCIVLPAQLVGQLSTGALRAVLAHEAEHIARRDPAWHALQRAALALFWWNPAMTRLAGWLDDARELACDAGASRRAGDSVQYAEALLCVAGQAQGAHAPRWLAGLAMASGTPLLEIRVDALLAPGRYAQRKQVAVSGLLAFAMMSAWAAASAATPQVRMSEPVDAWDPAIDVGTAQAEYERLTQAAQSEYERLSQSAQSEYERLSQEAQSGYEQLSQSARHEYEQALAAAERAPDPAQESSR